MVSVCCAESENTSRKRVGRWLAETHSVPNAMPCRIMTRIMKNNLAHITVNAWCECESMSGG
jgi:hypothetical protein